MNSIKRINFFEDLGEKKATVAYFLQEGPHTCNANCRGCYAGAGMNPFILERGIIDPPEARRDITELVKNFRVLVRGTEVLINPHYIPFLGIAENRVVLTNGLVLVKFPERLDLLADNNVTNIVITYPFDSTSATNRNLTDLLNQREVIQEGIRNIKQHRFQFVLQLSAIVTSDCCDLKCLDKICQEAMNLGADVLRFIPYVAMSGNVEIDKYALSKIERETLVERLTELKQKYEQRLIIHTPGVLGLFPLRAKKKKILQPDLELSDEKLICPAGIYYFAISALRKKDDSGKSYRPVTPCHFRMDAEIGRYYGGSDLQIDEELVRRLFSDVDRTDCPAQNHWYNKRLQKK